MSDTRPRRSFRELERDYANGNKKPLDDLIRAWRGIQEAEPSPALQYKVADAPGVPSVDDNSFFTIAGWHGEPFRAAGYYNNTDWWGGYCAHGNVLFPVWHRAYLWRIEKALQSIPGCQDVMMAYWDETELDDQGHRMGIPDTFLKPKWTLDGQEIDNPLHSYKFQLSVMDKAGGNGGAASGYDYSKDLGYRTMRYPYSGLDGSTTKAAAKAHNHWVDELGPEKVNNLLNGNVLSWLGPNVKNHEGKEIPTATYKKYAECLDAPNYTVFSNTTSAAQWNHDINASKSKDGIQAIVQPLEQPHNDIHLAIGGFEGFGSDFNNYPDANGDMGENDTAAFDPIFFFHHCHIDRMFWLWQERHDAMTKLDVMVGYPGTNSTGEQGPVPGMAANEWLDMDTPLRPFHYNDAGKVGRALTGNDMTDIRKIGYTYEGGSVPKIPVSAPAGESKLQSLATGASLEISGVSRNRIAGSFVMKTFKKDADGTETLIDVHSVLSRWAVSGCANCQTHLDVKHVLSLNHLLSSEVNSATFDTKLVTRHSAHQILGESEKDAEKVQVPTTVVKWQREN